MKQTLIAIACILYVLSPIDILPDLLPVLGWLDDLGAIGWTLHQLTQGGAGKGGEVS